MKQVLLAVVILSALFVSCTPKKQKPENGAALVTEPQEKKNTNPTRSYKLKAEDQIQLEKKKRARKQDSIRQVKNHGHAH